MNLVSFEYIIIHYSPNLGDLRGGIIYYYK